MIGRQEREVMAFVAARPSVMMMVTGRTRIANPRNALPQASRPRNQKVHARRDPPVERGRAAKADQLKPPMSLFPDRTRSPQEAMTLSQCVQRWRRPSNTESQAAMTAVTIPGQS